MNTTPLSTMLASIGKDLYVAVICDVLDNLGYREQAMHPRLRPLISDPDQCGFVGRARTLRWMEVDYVDDNDVYGLEIEAMDSLGPGDVVLHSTDYARRSAPWGELMTEVAMRNGAVGCVCDSNIRDCRRIVELGFPVFHAGIYPLDSKGRSIVKAYDVPVRCGDVLVHPGDLLFADLDGVVVIPHAIQEKVIDLAREKATTETQMRRALGEGATLRDAHERFGIL